MNYCIRHSSNDSQGNLQRSLLNLGIINYTKSFLNASIYHMRGVLQLPILRQRLNQASIPNPMDKNFGIFLWKNHFTKIFSGGLNLMVVKKQNTPNHATQSLSHSLFGIIFYNDLIRY